MLAAIVGNQDHMLSPLPDLNLCQEVDGLWEGHQAVLVQDEFLQLRAPVRTGPARALGDVVLQLGSPQFLSQSKGST